MNINELLKQDSDVEEVKDFVGGGGFIKDTDVYLMKITHAFFEESKGGALGVNISFKHADENNTQFSSTIYVTSGKAKGQKPYYISKNNKKVPLPGYTLVDDMVRLASNDASNLETVTTTTKAVEAYDAAAGGKINKNVEVIDHLSGAVLRVGLLRTKVNKWNNGAPTADVMERNEIDRVFSQDDRTIREVVANKPAEIQATWLEQNKGQTRDNTTITAEASTVSAEVAAPADNTDDLFGDA